MDKRTVYQINIWARENDIGSIQFYALGNGKWVLEENGESWDTYKHLCEGTFTECVECLKNTYDLDIVRSWED